MTEFSPIYHPQNEVSVIEPNARDNSEERWQISSSSYQVSEKRARWYFNKLMQHNRNDGFISRLINDYLHWSKQQKTQSSAMRLSELERQQSSHQLSSLSFLQKLDADRQLNQYLDKSIAYIFLRDMGQSLQDKTTQRHIKRCTAQVKSWVRTQVSKENMSSNDSELWLINKASEYQLQHTLFWLNQKLAQIKQRMPESMNTTQGLRKLVKIIAGVSLHNMLSQTESLDKTQMGALLDRSIRLGYCYGLTYPFIDDIQDSATLLSPKEKETFNLAIRQSLLTGNVVDCPKFKEPHASFMEFIYQELKAAFETIRTELGETHSNLFFEQSFVFFEAQNIDRNRSFEHIPYTSDQLYIPIILKASGCRLIARSILGEKNESHFEHHTFCFGIYNQFNDDIKDIFDDIAEGNVTPYSQYLVLARQGKATNIENPYRIYWTVVDYLIREVYKNHPQTKALLLERSINAHKSLRASVGDERYQQLRKELLFTGNQPFDRLIDELVKTPNDVAWFDKLISRHVAEHFEQRHESHQHFWSMYNAIKQKIEPKLPLLTSRISKSNHLINAANYSLNAGGKRLRSVLAYYVANQYYELNHEQSLVIARLLEYMHTASLIFDDKPTQDNADYRRGALTLHKAVNCEATAELAGVSLIMKAVEIQSELKEIEPAKVLKSLSYAAQVTQAICEGQLLDLKSKRQITELHQLEHLTFLKTGLAIEAALVIPAILAGENDIQINHLKRFARELGMAFQIKDDLLDITAKFEQLGKPVAQDKDKSTFVTLLGQQQAEHRLADHYYGALAQLQHFPAIRHFLRQILDYSVLRNH